MRDALSGPARQQSTNSIEFFGWHRSFVEQGREQCASPYKSFRVMRGHRLSTVRIP